MKRDFSEASQKQILMYAEEVTPETFIGHVIDVVEDAIQYVKHLFTKPSAATSQEKLEKYCKEVVDKRNLWTEEINNVFFLANAADAEYAAKGAKISDAGTKLLHELQLLRSMTAVDTLGDIALLGSINISFNTHAMLSDDQLVAFLKGTDDSIYQYYASVGNVFSSVANMGIETALLISLFRHKDIWVSDLMLTPTKKTIIDYIKKNMLEGKAGYDSVDDIAKKLGLTSAEVRLMLQHPKGSRYNSMQCWNKYDDVQKIVNENYKKMLYDEAMGETFAKDFGLDLETAQAVVNGQVDGYTVSLYKDAVLKSLKSAAGKNDQIGAQAATSDIRTYISGYKKLYELQYTGNSDGTAEMDKLFKTMIADSMKNDESASKFLKEYCGYETVTDTDIKMLRTQTKMFESADWLGDTLKYSSKGLDAVVYLFADYSNELEMLDTLIETNSGNPEYQIALQEVRQEYTNKATTLMERFGEVMLNEGIDEAMKLVPGLSIAEGTIGLVGKVSGASSYTGAAQDIIAYSSVSNDAITAYSNSIQYAKEQEYSVASLKNVRTSFEIMKQTLTDYYDAQIEYADGMAFNALEDKQFKAYCEYEKSIIEKLELGDTYTATSYDAYLAKYGQRVAT